MLRARLTDVRSVAVFAGPARPVLHQRLRAAQLAGTTSALIDQITAAPLDGARSISSVLHGRLQRLARQTLGHDRDLGPAHPDQPRRRSAHELAAGLDQRARALGDQLTASPSRGSPVSSGS